VTLERRALFHCYYPCLSWKQKTLLKNKQFLNLKLLKAQKVL
jgi:hypothetical protein